MTKYQQPFEEKVKRAIRDALAVDPLITQTTLLENLNKRLHHSFAPAYIAKMSRKVVRQGWAEADNVHIEQRLNQSRENYRLARERILRILYWSTDNVIEGIKPPLPMDILDAAQKLVMLDLALLHAEVANGLYRRPLAEIAKNVHYEPLPLEVRETIVKTWRNFGILPLATIENMVGPAKQDEPAPTASA